MGTDSAMVAPEMIANIVGVYFLELHIILFSHHLPYYLHVFVHYNLWTALAIKCHVRRYFHLVSRASHFYGAVNKNGRFYSRPIKTGVSIHAP